MPETMEPRSALRAHVAPSASPSGEAGATLRERLDLTIHSLAALRGRETELADAVRDRFDVELPTSPKRVSAGHTAVLWSGPGKWIVVSTGGADVSTLPGAVVDLSDGRSVFNLSGPRAREMLGTLISLDLHPRAFAVGDVASTHAASIAVQLWQVDDAPTYEIAVACSYAATLWRWLVHAGAARGLDAKLG